MPLVILSLSPFSHFLSPFSVSLRQTHANSLRINCKFMQITESYLHMQRHITDTVYDERMHQDAWLWAPLTDFQHFISSETSWILSISRGQTARREQSTPTKIRSRRKKKSRGKDQKVPDRLWKSCLRAVSEVNIISGIIYEVKSIWITQWWLPNS